MKKLYEKRIRKEIKEIEENPMHDESILLEDENNFNKLIVTLPGPEGTKYENEIYEISFEIPNDYPFKEPKINFETPIDHPIFNQYKNGIPIFALFYGEDWSPDKNIKDIIEKIYFYMSPVETRIDTYFNKKYRFTFDKRPIHSLIEKSLGHSLQETQELAFVGSNVPVLNGFFTAHCNHYPIKIKPDDIWLLIIQAFANHIDLNFSRLKKYFVNFEEKKELIVKYPLSDIKEINKEILEDFSKQIVEQITNYIGKELINILSPNFTTTTYDSKIICQISIMGAFKHYFDYGMMICGCGVPYVVLDGTTEDYKKIIDKAVYLKKYEFGWYIDRIIPHLEKMVEAKEGKMDKEYFKNMIQKKELIEVKYGASGIKKGEYQVNVLSGWFLQFFSHIKSKDRKKTFEFNDESIKINDFELLANQILRVPFILDDDVNKKKYNMNFEAGFVGCDQNENKEVFPVQGWWANDKKYYDNDYH